MKLWGLGFGLEKIGLAAHRRPVVFSILLVLVCVVCLSAIRGVRFDGNVISVLPADSTAFQEYDKQKSNFRDFSRDIAVIIRSPRVNTASGLEDIRFMQLELAVSEGVSNAISLFSIPDIDPETGDLRSYFPAEFEDDDKARELVAQLLQEYPQARSLVSPDDQAALIFVTLDIGIQGGGDGAAYKAFQDLKLTVEEVAPDDFELYYAGLTPIGLTIIQALVSDQIQLTLIGLILGALIAMVVFRSILAAIICAVPPALTAIMSIGLFAVIDLPINYLTTVLPTLALILAYADGIVLYFRWHRLNTISENPVPVTFSNNLENAIRRVGPASALTSITTAIAFFSFSITSSEAMVQFAWIGVVVVMLAFLSVMVGLPIACHWAIRLGIVKPGRKSAENNILGKLSVLASSRQPVRITILALAAIVGLLYVHSIIRAEYRVTDYLPHKSETFKAEKIANEVFGGRSFVFMAVPTADPGDLASKGNRKRLHDIESLLNRNFADSQVFSLNSIWKILENEAAIQQVARQLDTAAPATRRGYLSKDGTQMLVSLRIPSDQSITETLKQIEKIHTVFSTLEYGSQIKITGFPVLMAVEFTRLIDQLRTSLMIAVILGVVMIGIATRSPLIAIAALTPNLLPILFIEFIIYLQGGLINMSEVIALTLAFGIAIDNAVHVINVYQAERQSGKDVSLALHDALQEVAPALGASTIIICVSCFVTLTSSLPFIPVLGQLIIAILAVALFSNLIILPANILTLYRFKGKQR